MRLALHGSALVVVLEDGAEHLVDGASLAAYVDHGRSNTYGSELRAEWGEARVHRIGDVLHLCTTEVFDSCGGLSSSFVGFWRSDDGGRTWASDLRPPIVTNAALVAAITTHPSEPPSGSARARV
jgi:hypothetical protein